MTQPEMVALAKEAAAAHGLDETLLCAVAEQESSWYPNSIRFEMSWAMKLKGNPKIIGNHIQPPSLETEIVQRSMSWGLCQVLGQTARENGFTGSFMTELADPATGLEFGARVLALKLKQAGGDVRQALLFYNGGGDALYPAKVIERMAKYREK